jgi:hypothetical protein
LSLNHQHADGEKIVFVKAFQRIGKIEQTGDPPFAAGF